MFKDREEAGKLLAEKLSSYKKKRDVVVMGIPRGGIPVASEVSERLNLPLDVVVTKKVGAPDNEELAIGAVGPEGVSVFDENLIRRLQVSDDYKEKAVENKRGEIKERVEKFRKGREELDYEKLNVILIDDGVATGATVEAAIKYLRKKNVKKLILAVPVAPFENVDELETLVDEFVVLETPQLFRAVGQFYKDFPQTSDDEVIQLLHSD